MPWVPQSVLDALLSIAKERPQPSASNDAFVTRATSSSGGAIPVVLDGRLSAASHTSTVRTVSQSPVVGFAGEVPQAADDLPHDVSSAAVAFAYGNAAQVGVNREYARKALARGVHASDVVAALADGEEL